MHQSLRPFAAAGVALTAAGAIAVAPAIAPTPPDIQVPRMATAQVGLTAETDVLARWVEVFNASSANATAVSQFLFEAPGTALQQAIVNQVGYLGDVLNDPGSIGDVFESMGDNLEKAFSWATMQGLPDDINDPGLVPVLALSNDASHTLIAALLPSFLPEGTPEIVTPLVHFLASPLSGVLIGFAGPLVSPGVAALNSIMAGDLLNLPANVVDGFFNGATLSLDVLLPAINGAGVLPEGTTFDKLGISFGGLLSPGATVNTVPVGEVVGEPGIGGSIFSSLDLAITTNALGFPFTLAAPGVPVGPIGALASLSQIVAGAIGWDGEGNPLSKLTFPQLETESDSDALTGSRTGARALVADAAPPAAAAETDSAAVDSTATGSESEQSAPEEAGQDEGGPVVNTSAGATDLSDGNKAEPGKAGTTSSRPSEKLRSAAKEFGGDVRSTVKKLRTGVRDTVKGLSGRGAKADAGSTAGSGATGGEGSDSSS
ncbi:outer membrane porin GjpA [Mycolicibacterium sp. 050232]|uniref:outer membrane porin GjpA n=1 Tax=Mycolicibacterium sp. 050232 TaxID=3113982 RepID=UPI002E280242|nr:outer membrane porin GjpA [Mycolicibacterium sp. 050232]MED5814005.1 outer membrane porin GjpA [Mycolicibacterium sp. 050232]